MKPKALKRSLAVLLAGMMLLSQSAYADNMAAEVPDIQETLTEELPTPDVPADMTENAPADDAGEEVIQNAPIAYADIMNETEAYTPEQEDAAADEDSYADIKAKKEWQAKGGKYKPELVGAEDEEEEYEDAPWSGGDAAEITLDDAFEITVVDRVPTWFVFVPEETGNYKFYSFDCSEDGDPYGYLYDETGESIAYDDDSATGEDLNFAIRCSLTAGETYYFAATALSSSDTVYSVSIAQVATIVDFTPAPIEGAHLIKESPRCGDWYDDGEGEYFEYYGTAIQELFTIEYTLSDGTTGEWTYSPRSGYHVVADSVVEIEFDSAAAVVGTNTAVMVIDGIEKTVQFEMIELPDLESIRVEKNPDAKAMLIGWEQYGYWEDEETEDEYFAFSWNFLMSQFVIHAEYKDGNTNDWQYDSDEENDYLDEKYPIEVYYTVYEDSVVLDIIVGEFEESIELDTVTFDEVSSGTITDTKDFSMSGDDFIVYAFVPPSSGQYDVTVASDYGTDINVFDSSSHRVDFEDSFYNKDGYTYTFELTEGQTYYFLVDSYSERDNVTGTLSIKKHVSVRSFTAINDGFVPTIGSEVQGFYVEDDPTTFLFDPVYIAKAFTIHLAFDDGTTAVWRFDDDKSLSVRNNPIEFEQITDPPYVTEDGVAEIKIGNLFPQTVDFKVSRTIPTVTGLTVTQVNPIHMGFDAYWRNGRGNSKYVSPYYQQLFSSLEITATYEDGTVVKRRYDENEPEVFYDETMKTDFDDIYRISLECVDPESWTIGNANVLKATVGGKTASTNMTVSDMLSGIDVYEVPFTEVTKSKTPFTVDRQKRYEHACIIKAPATGAYAFQVLTDDANAETYWGLYTTEGYELTDNETDGILTSEKVTASLEEGTTYIFMCYSFSDRSDSHEATLCIDLPENAAWPTPTPTPTPSPTPTPTPSGGKLFDDVKDPSHAYYKAIYWARDAGITKGYSDGTFGINRSCTRGEMIMFLWRFADKPEPKAASKSPFKDVPTSHTFYKAILWAYQTGVTKGYSDGTFGINRNVSRGEFMMFLWRQKGKLEPTAVSKSPFSDVPQSHTFYKAILWGSQNGITKGYTSGAKKGMFGINDDCTRGQIVTFLYRAQ